MTDLLVLHDRGASGGAEWAAAFADWPGGVHAPDLPGHHGTAPPVGGNYELRDTVYAALDVLRAAAPETVLVVGVGQSGAAAQTLALGGRAVGVVLVDGLGGPWLDPDDLDGRRRDMLRQILTTPEALADPVPGADDPRAAMVVGPADRGFAVRQAEAMPVPVLIVETPASPTPDADDLADHFPRATLVRIDARRPELVAAAVRSWSPAP